MNSELQAPQGECGSRPMQSNSPPPRETQADGILSCEPAASHRENAVPGLCLHLSNKRPQREAEETGQHYCV